MAMRQKRVDIFETELLILEIKSEIRKFSMMAFRDARDGVERAWIGVEKEVYFQRVQFYIASKVRLG